MKVIEPANGLEKSLNDAEAEADLLLKHAADTLSSVKAYKNAARDGDLRAMTRAMGDLERNITSLSREGANAKTAWDLQEEEYLTTEAFRSELIGLAQSA